MLSLLMIATPLFDISPLLFSPCHAFFLSLRFRCRHFFFFFLPLFFRFSMIRHFAMLITLSPLLLMLADFRPPTLMLPIFFRRRFSFFDAMLFIFAFLSLFIIPPSQHVTTPEHVPMFIDSCCRCFRYFHADIDAFFHAFLFDAAAFLSSLIFSSIFFFHFR